MTKLKCIIPVEITMSIIDNIDKTTGINFSVEQLKEKMSLDPNFKLVDLIDIPEIEKILDLSQLNSLSNMFTIDSEVRRKESNRPTMQILNDSDEEVWSNRAGKQLTNLPFDGPEPQFTVPRSSLEFISDDVLVFKIYKQYYHSYDTVVLNNKVALKLTHCFTRKDGYYYIGRVIDGDSSALVEEHIHIAYVSNYYRERTGDLSKLYFISGHGTLTFEQFNRHYKQKIDIAIASDHRFILGDFRGCDVIAQEYLKDKSARVTICHVGEKPRFNVETYSLASANWTYVGNFNSDDERDEYMTETSDVDIAWINVGREKSGTATNLKRRALKRSKEMFN